jgi:hypothetical protein
MMAMSFQVLPGTGRGTMRSMVEGSTRGVVFADDPSTAFGGPPPRSGEDF